MMSYWRITAMAALLAWAAPVMAVAAPATQPTTAPAAEKKAPAGPMLPGPAFVLQRFQKSLGELGLSDDERAKADAVMDHAHQQGLELSASLANLPFPERYAKIRAFGQDIRKQLAGVLSESEMKLLDSKLTGAFGSRAGGGQPGGSAATVNAQFETLQQAIAKLDLTDTQKQQIKDLIADTRQKIEDLRQNPDAPDMQQKLADVRKSVREKLQTILTPEQMQQIAEYFRQQGGAAAGQRRGNFTARSSAPIADHKPADLDFSGPQAGDEPPKVKIIETNGRVFDPTRYKGHVLVLEFGSMTSPVFRAHAAAMEKLKRAESGRAFFLIVYTREAFPTGDKDLDRNRDEGISIDQARNLDERKAQALETQRELRLTIPMAVDSMDDAVSKAYDAFPNGAIVIGKDGKIAARQDWTNPDSLKEMIDDAANATPASSASPTLGNAS